MTYDHKQTSPLYLVLFVAAGGVLIGLSTTPAPPASAIAAVIAADALLVLAALSFVHLRVRDEGEHLAARFGPLPLFRKRIPYARMVAAEPARSSFWDGWGIHYMPGKGWIYNLWGFDCVAIGMDDGRTIRIGTDDPAGLTAFLRTRIGQAK